MAMRFSSSGGRLGFRPMMERAARGGRYFSEMKGKVLSEEERAAENVYIQKMERERMEKLKKKAEKEKHSEKGQQEKGGSVEDDQWSVLDAEFEGEALNLINNDQKLLDNFGG